MTLPKHVPKLTAEWRKSLYSDKGGDCVEVRKIVAVEVRDTKDRDGGQLAVAAPAWTALLDQLR